jgi:glycine cleavage system protein P-like pyridoxal-binding family
MMFECSTVRYLQKLSSHRETGDIALASAASSALNIVSDINETSMTEVELECLHHLVDALFQEGHGSMLTHLQEGAPDCAICDALSKAATRQAGRSGARG